jgi:hypothetical protein
MIESGSEPFSVQVSKSHSVYFTETDVSVFLISSTLQESPRRGHTRGTQWPSLSNKPNSNQRKRQKGETSGGRREDFVEREKLDEGTNLAERGFSSAFCETQE